MILRYNPTTQKHLSVVNTVSYQNVPMPRGIAAVLHHCEKHGAQITVASCDRRDNIIAEHNKQFKTNLHGQQYLIDLYQSGQGNPANPVNRTSHCYFSDGNYIFRDVKGVSVPAGGKLPWYEVGIDLTDRGDEGTNTHFSGIAHQLGYDVVHPYSTGSELHHVNIVSSPVKILERAGVISRLRL